MKNKILYISLTGMSEALGRSQVFEYLIELSKRNEIHLISFERAEDKANINDIEELANKYNIKWKYFEYSNRYGVFSTIIQIVTAIIYAITIIKKYEINIIHSRSMIPATMAVILKKIFGIHHLFDIRGFVFDEKVDSGRLSKNSTLYKSLLKLENWLYKNSDHVVTLTQRSKEIISERYNIYEDEISVIPTCASRNSFKLLSQEDKNKFKYDLGFTKDDIILIHTGSVTNSYDFDSEVKLFKELHKKNSNIRLLVVNKGQHEFVKEKFEQYKIENHLYKITSSSFEDMHKYLNIADASIFFIPPTYSKQASTPTKFAENLLCHLPSITNKGVGDMQFYMKNYNVGLIFDLRDIEDNIDNIIFYMMKTKKTNQNYEFDVLFEKYFDKEKAVESYDRIYSKLIE